MKRRVEKGQMGHGIFAAREDTTEVQAIKTIDNLDS